MRSKFLLAMALIIVVAAGFTTIGMAYTASTENSGNTVSSEYVVLEQTNYTFGSNTNLKFSTVTTRTGSTYLVSGMTETITIGETTYKAIKVGESDTLTATLVGSPADTVDVYVQTYGDGFRDFHSNEDGWRYILKVSKNTGSEEIAVQYAVYDGQQVDRLTRICNWDCYDSSGVQTENNCLTIKTHNNITNYTYKTELYFAGPVKDGKAQSSVKPADDSGNTVVNGTIKFIYYSGGAPSES